MKMNSKEGYMFVQGSSVWKPWSMKAKYFILTDKCLYCYKRRGDLDAIPSDVLPLKGIAVTIDEEKRGLRKRYYIRLTSTQARKSLNLFCFLIEERNAWLTSILSSLAGKYTDKGLSRSLRRKSGKTLSLGECELNKRHQIESMEHSRHMSISCLELTNLSVVMDPLSPTRSVIPIRKTLNFSEAPAKKVSSSSLDVAIRTDCTATLLGSSESISLKRHKLSKSEKPKVATFSHKRHKSMSDLLSINSNEFSMTSSQKKKRKSKGLSMLNTNLNFKAISIGNLNRLK